MGIGSAGTTAVSQDNPLYEAVRDNGGYVETDDGGVTGGPNGDGTATTEQERLDDAHNPMGTDPEPDDSGGGGGGTDALVPGIGGSNDSRDATDPPETGADTGGSGSYTVPTTGSTAEQATADTDPDVGQDSVADNNRFNDVFGTDDSDGSGPLSDVKDHLDTAESIWSSGSPSSDGDDDSGGSYTVPTMDSTPEQAEADTDPTVSQDSVDDDNRSNDVINGSDSEQPTTPPAMAGMGQLSDALASIQERLAAQSQQSGAGITTQQMGVGAVLLLVVVLAASQQGDT